VQKTVGGKSAASRGGHVGSKKRIGGGKKHLTIGEDYPRKVCWKGMEKKSPKKQKTSWAMGVLTSSEFQEGDARSGGKR